jgi:hypothetical protein
MTGERREEEEEEKIMPSLMATSLRWRTHSARTNIGCTAVGCTIRKGGYEGLWGMFEGNFACTCAKKAYLKTFIFNFYF